MSSRKKWKPKITSGSSTPTPGPIVESVSEPLWSNEETCAFVLEVCAMTISKEFQMVEKKEAIWEEIVMRMQLRGFQRSSDAYSSKLAELVDQYDNIKSTNQESSLLASTGYLLHQIQKTWFRKPQSQMPSMLGTEIVNLTHGMSSNRNQNTEPELIKAFVVRNGDPKSFVRKIVSLKEDVKDDIELNSLKKEFYKSVRPIFASRCLILPESLDHDSTAILHRELQRIIKRGPVYLTALDIMKQLKGMSVSGGNSFMNHIINERLLIDDTWSHSYGNIETLIYNFGIGSDFYKGESDASFAGPKDQSKHGLAKLSFIIWKDKKVVWAEVIKSVESSNINVAEVYAAAALQFKCLELGIRNLEHWTDSAHVYGIMSGQLNISPHLEHNDIYISLRNIRKEFDKIIPVLKPRELMFLADALLRSEDRSKSKIEELLQKWEPHLNGEPLFKITQTRYANGIIHNLANRGKKYKNHHQPVYFLVSEKEKKIATFMEIKTALRPDKICIVIDRYEEKGTEFQDKLEKLLSSNTTYHTNGTVSQFFIYSNKETRQKSKTLNVVFDATLKLDCYFQEDSCTVVLTEPEEVGLMHQKEIVEVNALTFLFLHGVNFKQKWICQE